MNAVNVLERIEENGFEAYIVGGAVRDHLLGIPSSDIDICTNARVKDLLEIFNDVNITSNEYGACKLITNGERIDITTYRRDVRYDGNRRKVEIEYVDNLILDVQRRDFTMNTLCMNKNGLIIDILNGREDINNKVVRCVGNISDRLNEDPLRMLRAVRFSATLGFTIEENLYIELKKNASLIRELSKERIKEELTKILTNKNAIIGLDMLNELGFLEYMEVKYPNNLVYVSDICGMYSQLEVSNDFPFSKEEKDNIRIIKNILNYGTVDANVLFTYGLYFSQVAGSILGISKEVIANLDKTLNIRTLKDIDITSEEICDILDIIPSRVIHDVLDELKDLILKDKLVNNNISIRNYIFNNRKKWLDEGSII